MLLLRGGAGFTLVRTWEGEIVREINSLLVGFRPTPTITNIYTMNHSIGAYSNKGLFDNNELFWPFLCGNLLRDFDWYRSNHSNFRCPQIDLFDRVIVQEPKEKKSHPNFHLVPWSDIIPERNSQIRKTVGKEKFSIEIIRESRLWVGAI